MSKYFSYADYKNAESKWLDLLPKGWGRAPIKHLVSTRITDGPHETPEFIDEGVPFLSAEAVKNHALDFSKKRGYISRRLHKEYSRKCLPEKDDIFMVKSGNTTGALAIVETEEEFNIWSPLALVRVDKSKVIPRYAFYSMQADYFRTSVELSWSQGTQPNIGMGVIENLHLPVTSIQEQQKIAEFLDYETAKIDTLMEKQQQLIALLKEKRQAVISHAVTKGLPSITGSNAPMKDSGVEWLDVVPEHWSIVRLSFALKLESGDTITSDSIESEGEYLVYGGNGVRGYTLDYNCDGDFVLIGRQGALCGNINMASGKFFASEHAIVVYPRKPFNNVYLAEMLRYMDLGQYSMSAAQPGVSVERLNLLKIILPPENEQIEISKLIVKENFVFETLTKKCEAMIAFLQERRTALISAAVTGKIDVRDWQVPKQEQDSTA